MSDVYMATSDFGLKVLIGPMKGSIAEAIWEMTSEAQEKEIAQMLASFTEKIELILSQKLPVV